MSKWELSAVRELEELEREWAIAGDTEAGRHTISRIEALPTLESVSNQPIAWGIPGLIAMGAVNMWTGESGHGKSTLTSAAAWEISRGGEFLGRPCACHPVLILDVENPHAVVLERFRRLGITSDEQFRVWGHWCTDEPPSAGGAIVMEWIVRTEPKPLIVVDSLIGFHPGAENDSTETRRYMGQYRRLAALGAGVLLHHHTGKSEMSRLYRGSSDLKASVDLAFHLANLSDSPGLGTMRLRAFKTRFSATADLVFRYSSGQFILDEATPRQAVTESLGAILRANPGIGMVEFERLAAEKGLGRNRARRFLNDGVKAEVISCGRGDRNAKMFAWAEQAGSLFDE